MNPLVKVIIKNSLIVVITLAVIVFVIAKLDNASKNSIEKKITKTEMAAIKQNAIDSVNSLNRKHEIASIDSVNNSREKDRDSMSRKLNCYVATNKYLTDKLNKKEQAYYNDTTQHTLVNCDSLLVLKTEKIAINDSTINGLMHNNTSLQASLNDVNHKYELQVQETDQFKQSTETANKTVNELTVQLRKKANWWARNEKWIFFGAGGIITGLVLK